MGLKPSSLDRAKTTQNWVLKDRTHSDKTSIKVRSNDRNIERSNIRKFPDWTNSELTDSGTPRRRERRQRHGQRRHLHSRNSKSSSSHHSEKVRFGYQIIDIDAFLAKASLSNPGNIPVVLSSPCVLYQTRFGGYQDEIPLPLGMVVNAVFKNQNWLYVQTPHSEEGYIPYNTCLPLGILPPPSSKTSPCWETHTDIFPRPTGNKTDYEKLRVGSKSECGDSLGRYYNFRQPVLNCGEHSIDRLYLKATSHPKDKGFCQTLLVISDDFQSDDHNTLAVNKNDVVVLINRHMNNWFWVRNKLGQEGLIPSHIAGDGYL
nr:PREDICTED: uncharacterized protein LOC109043990 [Bemisia tabaci]